MSTSSTAPGRYVDVTRLLVRYRGTIRSTGTDRVNAAYAEQSSGLGLTSCFWTGKDFRFLSQGATQRLQHFLCDVPSRYQSRLNYPILWFRALALSKPITRGHLLLAPSGQWLAEEKAWRWLTERGIRVFVFIHDLIPLDFPEYCSGGAKKLTLKRVELSLKHSSGIIINSEDTKSSLERHASQLGLKPPLSCVAPLGCKSISSDSCHRSRPPDTERPFFVVLGTIEPRKNHLLLLDVWRHLAQEMGDHTPLLYIIGKRGWECEQVVDLLDRCDAIRPHVVQRSDLPDSEVHGLLERARALLFPSFAEGFGLPVLEAISAGTPVICSPLESICEFAQGIPEYAEPYDGAMWLRLIKEYATSDSVARSEQINRMASFKPLTWESHFRRVAALLNDVIGSRVPDPAPGNGQPTR